MERLFSNEGGSYLDIANTEIVGASQIGSVVYFDSEDEFMSVFGLQVVDSIASVRSERFLSLRRKICAHATRLT